MQNLNNYTEKICKQWGLEMYIVDQYADSKTSNCMLSLSENNDTPGNVDVPLRWVHAMLPLIKNKYYILGVCFGSLSCPSCNVHTPYCLMWHAQPYNIFPHSHKQHDLQGKKKSYWTQNVWFSLQLLSETFLILQRTEWDMITMYIGLYAK